VDDVVVAENLTKRWGSTAVLDGATFTIGGGVTGLLGANGAGKTTLLGMVLGLHAGESGTLRVLGKDPWAAGPEVRTHIGYAPEHEALPPDVRAHDFVRHVAELHGIPRRHAIARASDALFEVSLGEERFRPIGTMSTGQKQRVKLAQAIVHDPAIVLLDEPTNGLDPVQRDQMLALVRRCGHELGLNVVLSSHLLEEVERTCDRVVILANGQATLSSGIRELEAEGTEIEVVVDVRDEPADGVMGRVQAEMVRHGCTVASIEAAVLRVEYVDAATYDRLAAGLVAADVGVIRLRRTRRTLADAFLAANSPDAAQNDTQNDAQNDTQTAAQTDTRTGTRTGTGQPGGEG
jgi:ABC-2 type transport system ATP-binding protein